MLKINNECWKEIQVPIIDKVFTELSTLEADFPETSIILCHFHVIDYLKREICKRDYGCTGFENLLLKTFITMMARATADEIFDHFLIALKEL